MPDVDAKTVKLLKGCVLETSGGDEWGEMTKVGQRLHERVPGFSSKVYGCSNLSRLLTKAGTFELIKRENVVYVRICRAA